MRRHATCAPPSPFCRHLLTGADAGGGGGGGDGSDGGGDYKADRGARLYGEMSWKRFLCYACFRLYSWAKHRRMAGL